MTNTRAGTQASHQQDSTRQLVTLPVELHVPAEARDRLWHGGLALAVLGLALLLWGVASQLRARRRSALAGHGQMRRHVEQEVAPAASARLPQ